MYKDRDNQYYGEFSEFDFREALSTLEFEDLGELSKGDIVYECFKRRTVKTRVLSEPIKRTKEYSHRTYSSWEWCAEILEVNDYKLMNGKLNKIRVECSKKTQEYLVSNMPCQGIPSLYSEDIYVYLGK